MDLPLHPATVHYPFTLLTLSHALNALNAVRPSLPQQITSYLPPTHLTTQISYYALSLGLLTALVAIASGVAQALKAVQAQGLYEKDGKTIKPKFVTLAVHALSADVVTAASAWKWWGMDANAITKGGVSTAAKIDQAALGLVMVAGLVFAAHNGGELVYKFGMGMGSAKKAKSG